MQWDQLVYGLLLVLVAMNAIAFYAENYIYVGVDANGNAIPFMFTGYESGNTYSQESINNQLEDSRPNFDPLLENSQPDNIWGIMSSGFSSFLDFLGQLYGLASGYQRILNTLFNPLNTADAGVCVANPLNQGCVGTGLATIISTILGIPILLGVILFIKLILQTVGIAK